MNAHRLIGVFLLLAAASLLWASPLDSHKISNARFLGWVNLQDLCTDTAIDQVWRQRLYDIPRGYDGYTMISYKVARTDSAAQAAQIVKELNHVRRFNDYTAKGYKVIADPWVVREYQCVKFSVRGIDHTTDRDTAHRADLYTFAVTMDNWFIWLEVRQVVTGPEQVQADRAMEKAGGRQMAEDLVDLVYALWNPMPDTPPKTDEVAPPVTPPKPEEVKPPVEQPKPEEVKPPVEQPKPEEVKPPVEQSKPEEVKPPVETPGPPVTPSLPAGTKAWNTPDGALTLVIPEAWTVSGKNVFEITGPAGAGARILPPEPYKTADELSRVLRDFTETQRDISEKGFASKEFNISGATGVQVHYTAVHGRTMHIYYFGKSGRLWRLEIDMDGTKTPLTAELEQMVNRLTVQ